MVSSAVVCTGSARGREKMTGSYGNHCCLRKPSKGAPLEACT